jgi:hypothetical protein
LDLLAGAQAAGGLIYVYFGLPLGLASLGLRVGLLRANGPALASLRAGLRLRRTLRIPQALGRAIALAAVGLTLTADFHDKASGLAM